MTQLLYRIEPEHGRQPAGGRLRDILLGVLAALMPDREFANGGKEAAYLKPFRELPAQRPAASRLPLIQAAVDSPHPAEKELLLAREQELPLIDTLCLALCYDVEHDPMLGRCLAFLQKPMGGSRPTLGLFGAIFGFAGLQPDIPVMAAIAGGRAVSLGLLRLLNEGAPLAEQVVQIHPALALSPEAPEEHWPGAAVTPIQEYLILPESIAAQARAHARGLAAASGGVLVLRGTARQEALAAARLVAAEYGSRPLFIHDEKRALPALGPICRSRRLLPVFEYGCAPGETARLPDIRGYAGPVLVTAGLEGSFEGAYSHMGQWIIPRPTREERRHLWDLHLGASHLSARLADDHVHSTARIVALGRLARHYSIGAGKACAGLEDVRRAACAGETSALGALAQFIDLDMDDDALVLRPFTRRQLDLLETRCRLRERLGENLGASIQARYQMGVKVLFTGPSGTGKTLAAGWLAHRLGVPLYRVDLAAVNSKYIGETEKNLARLLGQAEQEEVLLLFDEADAVFGKRTEIKDSNDRFANAQTNYLLQRIETYSGVVVLTSNSKARFDGAFTRRLDMMIDFPAPGPEERRAIWLSHLGGFHRLSKANINQLAVQCTLTGGHIRNVVLSAAVIAKSLGREIGFEDIIAALADEYRKLGKQMAPELLEGGRADRAKTP